MYQFSLFAPALDLHVQSSGLYAGSPHTLWAVIFNEPRYCRGEPCSAADLPLSPGHDPRVEASIVFAGGGVSNTDGIGRFGGRVRKGRARESKR